MMGVQISIRLMCEIVQTKFDFIDTLFKDRYRSVFFDLPAFPVEKTGGD